MTPAVVCGYCAPPHAIRSGTLPASHGMCDKAAAILNAQLDAEEAKRKGFLARPDARDYPIHAKTADPLTR